MYAVCSRDLGTLKTRFVKALDRLGLLQYVYMLSVNTAALNPAILIRNLPIMLQGAPDGLPIPSERMIALIISKPYIRIYLDDGKSTARLIRNLLKNNDLKPERFVTLDFGCGCGRVIRHLTEFGGLYGTDYNQELID